MEQWVTYLGHFFNLVFVVLVSWHLYDMLVRVPIRKMMRQIFNPSVTPDYTRSETWKEYRSLDKAPDVDDLLDKMSDLMRERDDPNSVYPHAFYDNEIAAIKRILQIESRYRD